MLPKTDKMGRKEFRSMKFKQKWIDGRSNALQDGVKYDVTMTNVQSDPSESSPLSDETTEILPVWPVRPWRTHGHHGVHQHGC